MYKDIEERHRTTPFSKQCHGNGRLMRGSKDRVESEFISR